MAKVMINLSERGHRLVENFVSKDFCYFFHHLKVHIVVDVQSASFSHTVSILSIKSSNQKKLI